MPEVTSKMKSHSKLNQLIIPLVALLILIVVNLIADPSFFRITMEIDKAGSPILHGNLISILDNGSELAILAIGMTLVTAATGGQDISVGAAVAIAGSAAMRLLCGAEGDSTPQCSLIVAFIIALVSALLCGAFNGALVAFFKIPPMVATLILYTAGRSIASWINNCRNLSLYDDTLNAIGTHIPGIPIPTPIFIAIICFILIALVLKFTALGTYIQAVGINEKSSRLNGINPIVIKFVSFIVLGVCVAVVGFVKISRSGTIAYAAVAKDIEMDAILAVALGGNALSGGKFNLVSSVIGAYIIQFLTVTLYSFDVSAVSLPAYKAVVVIILVVMSAPAVRDKISSFQKKRAVAKEAA